jgi:predicted PurR-regulated permease PerM
MNKGAEGKLGKLASSKYLSWINKYNIDWRSSLQEGVQGAAKAATAVVNKTSASVLGLIVSLLVSLFCMFYLFIDGEAFVHRLNHLIPLRQEYKDLLFARFLQTSRATVKATLLIGLIQGTLGALTLLIFGIKSWFLWGVIMIILSVIPMLGAGTVLIPAGIIQMILGNVWQGIALIFISVAVITNIDSVMRPRIVGRQAKMHDLVIFFSTIGGIVVFGLLGFIIGPVIAALFMTFIDIYSTEFRDYLEN